MAVPTVCNAATVCNPYRLQVAVRFPLAVSLGASQFTHSLMKGKSSSHYLFLFPCRVSAGVVAIYNTLTGSLSTPGDAKRYVLFLEIISDPFRE
jgi:hypothetical protein